MPLSNQHADFNLFKKPSRDGLVQIWYARFWNPNEGRYSVTRSTGIVVKGKKERKDQANRVAREILPEVYAMFNRAIEPDELNIPLFDYLEAFWQIESPYFLTFSREKGRKPSTYYIKCNHEDVRRWLRPFPGLQDVTLKTLTKRVIESWKTWAIHQDISNRRCNSILQTMRVPVRQAVLNDLIEKDPFLNIKQLKKIKPKKGIFSLENLQQVIKNKGIDVRYRALILFSCGCSMRRGEMLALKWSDVDKFKKKILVSNNFVTHEKELKAPKNGESRLVPIVDYVSDILTELADNHPDSANEFVFYSTKQPKTHMSISGANYAFKQIIKSLGITEEKRKASGLTLHSGRHTFVTHSRNAGIPDAVIQAIVGHSSPEMMAQYDQTKQILDFKNINEALTKYYQENINDRPDHSPESTEI